MQIKLMLVDDHPLFLEGLQYLLETHGVDIAGVAHNGREALFKARLLKPDVILMDVRMPEGSGVEALKLIKAEMPNIKIVMLTTSEEDDDLLRAMKYGAAGYLLKSSINAQALVETLSDLEKGEVPHSTGFAAKLLKEFQKRGSSEHKSCGYVDGVVQEDRLTDRQLEILYLTAQGITYKEAGEALGISERTVKYHMKRIIEILHLENRSQVIAYAARIGLVEGTPSDV